MRKYTVKSAPSEEEKSNLAFLPSFLQNLLIFRGIKSAADAKVFLEPDYDLHTHDPFLLKDMDKAVKRILKALEEGERICVYSDYDADGVPGAGVLHELFFQLDYLDKVTFYIPHRDDEGFGFHVHAVQKLKDDGVSLIITVDCGTVDLKAVEKANELGIDVIITDHHLPQEGKMPSAYAVVNPAREDCEYPFKKLCGAGVAFKLAQAFYKLAEEGVESRFLAKLKTGGEKWLLDLVSLATISDMVPLLGENRVLAKWGLHVLRKTKRGGLRKLLSIIRADMNHLTEDDVSFMITPRINSASRMGDAIFAFNLLTAKNDFEANTSAEKLEHLNNERKGFSAALTKSVKHRISELPKDKRNLKVLVMGNPEWKPAILGPVANNLVDEYGVPVFLWGRAGGVIKGSCRAPKGMNLVEMMNKVKPGIFLEFGGHSASGGYSLNQENVHLLEGELIRILENIPAVSDAEDILDADYVLNLKDVNWDNYKMIEQMSPFGMDNPKPVFIFKDVIIKNVKIFGKAKEHLELLFTNENGGSIKAIGFFMGADDLPYKTGSKIDLAGSFEKSVFRGYTELRLRIVEIFNSEV